MGWFNAFITTNLIGIGSNLDNSGVGVAYGAAKIRIPHWVNGVINSIGCLFAFLGACTGAFVGHFISSVQAAWVSCAVLCAVGFFILYAAYIRPLMRKNISEFILPKPRMRDAILLGFALSFTNLASGFGATVANHISMWSVVGSITVWGYGMVWFGNVVGIGALSRILGNYSSLVSGLILVAVGIHQVYGL